MPDLVCAIVPTFNRREMVCESIGGLVAQTRPLDAILVIDSRSTDGTYEAVGRRFPGVRILRLDENRGSAGGFAEGARWAYENGFDWIWFIDDDSRVADNCLEALLAAHSDSAGGTSSVYGPVRYWNDDRTFAGLPAASWDMTRLWVGPDEARTPVTTVYRTPEELPEVTEVRDLAFEGMLVPRRAVELAGYPAPGFFTQADDTDLCFRFLAAGFRLKLVARAHIFRLIRTDQVRLSPAKARFVVRNRIWLNRLYGKSWKVRVVRSWLWALRFFLPSVLRLRFLYERPFFAAMFLAVREGLFDDPPVPPPRPAPGRAT